MCVQRRKRPARRGITLIEILIVVVLLGIAGSMIIPSMAQVGVLRIQSGLRTAVSDIAFAQSDAMAAQSRRAVVFGRIARLNPNTGAWEIVEGNGYTLYAPIPGAATIDLANDWMVDPDSSGLRPFSRDFSAQDFGGAVIEDVDFNASQTLVFDELGGPVRDLTSDEPGEGGGFRMRGADATYQLNVEPYTGRITVVRIAVGGG